MKEHLDVDLRKQCTDGVHRSRKVVDQLSKETLFRGVTFIREYF
jgi:hypothetical protein